MVANPQICAEAENQMLVWLIMNELVGELLL